MSAKLRRLEEEGKIRDELVEWMKTARFQEIEDLRHHCRKERRHKKLMISCLTSEIKRRISKQRF